MAYLANTDEEEQQKQAGSSSGFNAFGGGAANQDQAGGGGGSNLSSWIGSSGGQASSKATNSSDEAQQNAQGYQSTYAGDDNQGAKQESQSGAQNKSFASGGMQPGLSGGGQGTGFINFQNYENNAPSQADAIASAGKKVVADETQNLEGAEHPVKGAIEGNVAQNSIWGDSPDQAAVTKTVEDQLGQGDGGVAAIQAGLNPQQLPDTVNYTPGKDYAASSAQLSETPVTGGQAKPSVIDYLAKDQIAKGGYTQGDRMLDNSLISGDVNAQAAIAANKKATDALQGRVQNEIPNLQAQATATNTKSGQTANEIQQGLTDTNNKLQNDIATATANYNAHPTAQTLAAEQAAVNAYKDWYAHGGAAGGTWTSTGGAGTTATAVVTPQQASEADNIFKLQHPGDNDPSHLPYPDPQHPGGGGTDATYGGTGTAGLDLNGFTPPTSVYDAGDKASGTGNHGMTTAGKYNNIINNPGFYQHAQQDLTGPEIAALVTLHPEMAGSYPRPSASDLQQAAQMLTWMQRQSDSQPQQVGGGGSPTPSYGSVVPKLLQSIHSQQQSPYDYGKSLGLDDATLKSMGITPQGTSFKSEDRRQ